MMKRYDNPTTYKVNTTRASYAVTLERLHNDHNGNIRYKATVIVLQVHGEPEPVRDFYTTRFSFTGHQLGEAKEAEFIVNHYESLLD